jgi:hypothetical protein
MVRTAVQCARRDYLVAGAAGAGGGVASTGAGNVYSDGGDGVGRGADGATGTVAGLAGGVAAAGWPGFTPVLGGAKGKSSTAVTLVTK